MILPWNCQDWNHRNTCDKIMDTIPAEVLYLFFITGRICAFIVSAATGFSGGQIARTGTTL